MSETLKRRAFVKQVVVAGSAAALASSAQTVGAHTSKPANKPQAKSQGYHETDHIKAYYKTAAF